MGNPQKSRHELESEHHDTPGTPIRGRGQSGYEEPDTSNGNPAGQVPISRQDAASYIHDMAVELKAIAETANFSFLAYLLELAIEESVAQKRGRL